MFSNSTGLEYPRRLFVIPCSILILLSILNEHPRQPEKLYPVMTLFGEGFPPYLAPHFPIVVAAELNQDGLLDGIQSHTRPGL